MPTLNRTSKLPLYQQLYDVLRGNIAAGIWKPGDQLPAESELVVSYAVSRITVRQVLHMLAQEGLVCRERGRGTFVAHPRVEQVLQTIVSFTDDMRRRGLAPGTRTLSAGLLPAVEDIAAALGVAPGTELARIERLRLADGVPMSVEESYLDHSLVPGILELDFAGNPLRELIDTHYGIRWSRAQQVIRAVNASRAQAQTLDVPWRAALLCIERVSLSQKNVPVEFLRIYHRGDRYALHSELRG